MNTHFIRQLTDNEMQRESTHIVVNIKFRPTYYIRCENLVKCVYIYKGTNI